MFRANKNYSATPFNHESSVFSFLGKTNINNKTFVFHTNIFGSRIFLDFSKSRCFIERLNVCSSWVGNRNFNVYYYNRFRENEKPLFLGVS